VSECTHSMAIDTSLGRVQVIGSVVTPGPDKIETFLEIVKVLPHLPMGMKVRSCVAVLLKIVGSVELQNIELSLSVRNDLRGRACTGERLEAQEWSDGEHILVVGTEDGEALDLRYPNLQLGEKKIIDYTHHSMRLKIADLPELYNPSFHLVIAENDDPEPTETSAWFAVDQDHGFLLAQ